MLQKVQIFLEGTDPVSEKISWKTCLPMSAIPVSDGAAVLQRLQSRRYGIHWRFSGAGSRRKIPSKSVSLCRSSPTDALRYLASGTAVPFWVSIELSVKHIRKRSFSTAVFPAYDRVPAQFDVCVLDLTHTADLQCIIYIFLLISDILIKAEWVLPSVKLTVCPLNSGFPKCPDPRS